MNKGQHRVKLAVLAGMALWAAGARGAEDLAGRVEAVEQRFDRQASVSLGRSGLSIESPDKLYLLRLRGYVQTDARFFVDGGSAGEWMEYRGMPDCGGSGFVLQEAYADIVFHPGFNLRAGRFKGPVSLERLRSATNLGLVERAFPASLAPNRELGAQLYGSLLDGRADYAAGVFNGAPDGGSVNGHSDDRKDLIARVFVHPFKSSESAASLRGLGTGIAGTHCRRQGDLGDTQLASARTPGQNSFFGYPSSTNLKLSLTCEETSFEGGAAEGADRDNERVLFARAQVSFCPGGKRAA